MTTLAPLISTTDLAERLGAPDLRILDASWHLDGRDPCPDFLQARIPGAILFDLDASSDQDSALPHMLPAPEAFAERMGGLGIGSDDHIVVYDTVGLRSSPRAWWMLRVMGAHRVQVLDGGLPKWRAEHRTLESGPAPGAAAASFTAHMEGDAVAGIADVSGHLAAGGQVLDARSAGRFQGREPEPRVGLRSGHMPGATSLPFTALLAADGTMKRGPALEQAFRDAGVDLDLPVVTACGSGVTAAILSLGLAALGRTSRLYDGSWAEWGGRSDTDVAAP